MAQVVQHAHEDDEVELLAADEAIDVVDVALHELHVEPELLAGEARLAQIDRVVVDAQHARGAAALHFERIEAAVAADVEHGLAAEIVRHGVLEELPEIGREIAQRMIRRGLHAWVGSPRRKLWNQGPSSPTRASSDGFTQTA